MTISTTDPSLIMRHLDLWAPAHQGTSRARAAAAQRGAALGYAWGAEDHSAPGHPYVSSCDFSDAYALSVYLGDGYVPMPIRDAYATWAQTGRLVVPAYIHGARVVASVHREDGIVVARLVPHSSDPWNLDAYRVRYSHPYATSTR